MKSKLLKRIQNSKGVTLIEVVVATMISAMVFSVLMTALVQAIKIQGNNKIKYVLQQEANNCVEEIRAMDYLAFYEQYVNHGMTYTPDLTMNNQVLMDVEVRVHPVVDPDDSSIRTSYLQVIATGTNRLTGKDMAFVTYVARPRAVGVCNSSIAVSVERARKPGITPQPPVDNVTVRLKKKLDPVNQPATYTEVASMPTAHNGGVFFDLDVLNILGDLTPPGVDDAYEIAIDPPAGMLLNPHYGMDPALVNDMYHVNLNPLNLRANKVIEVEEACRLKLALQDGISGGSLSGEALFLSLVNNPHMEVDPYWEEPGNESTEPYRLSDGTTEYWLVEENGRFTMDQIWPSGSDVNDLRYGLRLSKYHTDTEGSLIRNAVVFPSADTGTLWDGQFSSPGAEEEIDLGKVYFPINFELRNLSKGGVNYNFEHAGYTIQLADAAGNILSSVFNEVKIDTLPPRGISSHYLCFQRAVKASPGTPYRLVLKDASGAYYIGHGPIYFNNCLDKKVLSGLELVPKP